MFGKARHQMSTRLLLWYTPTHIGIGHVCMALMGFSQLEDTLNEILVHIICKGMFTKSV
jgi:hypothetical protein